MSKFEQDRFVVSIPQNTIDDLKSRLRETRWPTDIDEKDDYYGTSQPYMKDLVRYWLEEFDWREAEKKLNEWDNYRVSIDGSPIHFIRKEGSGPSPIPLIMSHGWPWSYREWTKVIGPWPARRRMAVTRPTRSTRSTSSCRPSSASPSPTRRTVPI
jgi:microsomal epoxide hydrolase